MKRHPSVGWPVRLFDYISRMRGPLGWHQRFKPLTERRRHVLFNQATDWRSKVYPIMKTEWRYLDRF